MVSVNYEYLMHNYMLLKFTVSLFTMWASGVDPEWAGRRSKVSMSYFQNRLKYRGVDRLFTTVYLGSIPQCAKHANIAGSRSMPGNF